MNSYRPRRILHVLYNLEHGGIQQWLTTILAFNRKDRLQHDVVILDDGDWPLTSDVEKLGSRISVVAWRHNPIAFVRDLANHIRDHGPYDVVHSHVYYLSALVLLAAKVAGVGIRVAHSHGTLGLLPASLPRRIYAELCRRAIVSVSTLNVAVSASAARALFGASAPYRLLPCTIDTSLYHHYQPDAALRASLGIPAGAFVIGNIGRFATQKNHGFLVDLFAAYHRFDPTAHLCLVGTGDLMPKILAKVEVAGLTKHVTFLGRRTDVPHLMARAFDLHAFPSLYEGFGITAIEAQAANVPSIVSDAIPPEAVQIPELVTVLPLSASAEDWAMTIRDAKGRPRSSHSRPASLDIHTTIDDLEQIYSATLN